MFFQIVPTRTTFNAMIYLSVLEGLHVAMVSQIVVTNQMKKIVVSSLGIIYRTDCAILLCQKDHKAMALIFCAEMI